MKESSTDFSRRGFVQALGASAAASLGVPALATAAKWRPARPRFAGQGAHTYEFMHDWLVPPDPIKWGDTHGLAQDTQRRIYVAHTVNPSSSLPDAVVVFDENGHFIESWGGEFRGGAHGLDIREENGEEFLYHCDSRVRWCGRRRLQARTNAHTMRGAADSCRPTWRSRPVPEQNRATSLSAMATAHRSSTVTPLMANS
jgi:hypothetical protein